MWVPYTKICTMEGEYAYMDCGPGNGGFNRIGWNLKFLSGLSKEAAIDSSGLTTHATNLWRSQDGKLEMSAGSFQRLTLNLPHG